MNLSQSLILKNYQLLEKVGFGAFGEVFKAKEKTTGKYFAAKISLKPIFEDYDEEEEEEDKKDEEDEINKYPNSKIRNLIREVNIISKLNHPAIVKFAGFSLTNFLGEDKPVIITEFLSNGTLNDLINQERHGIAPDKWNDTRKLIVLYGIASAMSYLHSHKIIHRDLKPDNIMMTNELYPKITDFGLSKITHSNQDTITMNSTVGIKGTVIYLPPESLFDYQYSEACDVYAFAMIAYEIMTNEKPFDKCTFFQVMSNLVKGIRPKMNDLVPESYQNLICKCWESKASNRPTFDEIVDELRENELFITDTIDKVEFYNYIDYIDEYKSTFSSEKTILSIDEFMNKRKKNSLKPRIKSTRPSIFEKSSSDTEILNIDLKKAALHFKKEADKGDIQYMLCYAWLISNNNIEGFDQKEAIKYYKKAADKGEVAAMAIYALEIKPTDKKEYIRYIKMAADKGKEGIMMYTYAKIMENGDGVPVNLKEAIKYYKMAAESGYVDAMVDYAVLINKGVGSEIPPNKREFLHYMKTAAENGHKGALYFYGYELIRGEEYPADVEKGVKYIKEAIEKGSEKAMLFYAKILISGNYLPVDSSESMKYFEMAAENGSIEAMETYAKLLINGKYFDVDKTKAAKYFKMAADKGNSLSMYIYGRMLFDGDGIPSDVKKAIIYFKKAAGKGEVKAMVFYGTILSEGDHVAINMKESLHYFKMAVDKGDVSSMFRLGYTYERGLGVPVDMEQSALYYKMAADKGETTSMTQYGNFLYQGIGVKQNKKEGIRYMKMAADTGNLTCMYLYGYFIASEYSNIPDDAKEDIKYLKMAADRGDVESMYQYGIFQVNNTPANKKEAAKYFKMAADMNHEESMKIYAAMLENGEGIPANKDEAKRLLEKVSKI